MTSVIKEFISLILEAPVSRLSSVKDRLVTGVASETQFDAFIKAKKDDPGLSTLQSNEVFETLYNKNKNAFSLFKGEDPLWIVVPSTTGKNKWGYALAERLEQDFGGTASDILTIKSDLSIKKKQSYLKRADDIMTATSERIPEEYIGKTIVLVDDSLQTGETINSAIIALKILGIEEEQVFACVLVARPQYTIEPRAHDLVKATKALYIALSQAGTARSAVVVRNAMNKAFVGGSKAQLQKFILQLGTVYEKGWWSLDAPIMKTQKTKIPLRLYNDVKNNEFY